MIPKNEMSLGLRQRTRERIQLGELPNRKPSSTWGGMGSGARCAVCDGYLSSSEMELEFEIKPLDGQNGGIYRMHVSCYTDWESELLDGSGCVVLCSEDANVPPGRDASNESETSVGQSR